MALSDHSFFVNAASGPLLNAFYKTAISVGRDEKRNQINQPIHPFRYTMLGELLLYPGRLTVLLTQYEGKKSTSDSVVEAIR